jgi:pantoate--beta-alanine ligase
MGFLHEGHLSLMRRARSSVGADGLVVVSVYVNPTQFGPREDLEKYPRDFARDIRLCREAGVDVIFHPSNEEMYPADESGGFSTFVVEESCSRRMEGERRPGHFRGVATVVARLFNLVQPTVAVFGEKDFQQTAVVRRMVRDLAFPVRIVVAPTVREADGVALSSRNTYLGELARPKARVLVQAIREARQWVRARRRVSAQVLTRKVAERVNGVEGVRLEYVSFFEPRTLAELKVVTRGSRMALAVWVGETRLIDNGEL